MSRWHAVLGSLAPAVLGSPQGSLSAVGRASLLKAEGLSVVAVPILPAWSRGERACGPPACRPAHGPSPTRRCSVGSSPLRPAEQGLTWAASHFLPPPALPAPPVCAPDVLPLPREPHKQSGPLCSRKWVPGVSGHRPCGVPSCDTTGWPRSPARHPTPRAGRGPRGLVSMGGDGPRPPPSPAGPPAMGRAPVTPRDPAAPPPWGPQPSWSSVSRASHVLRAVCLASPDPGTQP